MSSPGERHVTMCGTPNFIRLAFFLLHPQSFFRLQLKSWTLFSLFKLTVVSHSFVSSASSNLVLNHISRPSSEHQNDVFPLSKFADIHCRELMHSFYLTPPPPPYLIYWARALSIWRPSFLFSFKSFPMWHQSISVLKLYLDMGIRQTPSIKEITYLLEGT